MVDLATDPASFELDALEGEITELAGHLAAATCRWLELVASFDERRGWEPSGCHSCAHWLSWRCGISPVTAREQVRVARALQEHPAIREAFAAGELSYTKVRSLVRIAHPGTETDLIELARHATGAHLATIARARERVRRAESASAHRRRELSWHVDDLGDVVGTFRLPAAEGFEVLAGLRAALTHLDAPADAAASPTTDPDPDAAASPATATDPDAATSPATDPEPDAAASPTTDPDADAATSPNDPGPDAAASPEALDPGRATLADALVAMARAMARRARGPAADSSRVPPRTEVVVHVELGALTGGDGGAWIHDGPAVAPEVARRLACDGTTRTLVHDRRGTPLDLGRRQRTVNAALRLALELRDGGCVFPGCGRRHFLHAHHIRHWADGGPTSLANLALVCSHHHHLLHEHGWGIELDDARPRFVTPDGHRLDGASPAPGGAPEPVVAVRPEIDAHTIEPRWGGERLDVGLAIDALVSAERLHERAASLGAASSGPPVTGAVPPPVSLAAA